MTPIPTNAHISVIVTARDVERYIGRCLRSILDQNIPRTDYEVIVINDGSTDRTLFALEVFGQDIVLIDNSAPLGLPGSLNKGIARARGHYIVRLDGDDYVNREFLHVLALHLDMVPEIDAIACDYLLVNDHEIVLGVKDCLAEPIACGIMFRSEQLLDVGLYDEQFLLREDEDLRLRFLKKYSIERVRLPLYRYRRHKDNMTNDDTRMHEFKIMLDAKHGGADASRASRPPRGGRPS